MGQDAGLLEEIHFNTRLQYMLVKLKKGTTREQLEAIEPDFVNLTAAAGKGTMILAVVTAESLTGCFLAHHVTEATILRLLQSKDQICFSTFDMLEN